MKNLSSFMKSAAIVKGAVMVGASLVFVACQSAPSTPSPTPTTNQSGSTQIISSPAIFPSTSLATGSATASPTIQTGAEITIHVVGLDFSFDKKEIHVKKGDKVTITFENSEGFHDWVIDEFNVRTPKIAAGQTATVKFVADKVGTFEYYCSVGQHRKNGMWGKLIVE